MAIGTVTTGGLGNGTLTTTIPLVLLRGLAGGADAATTAYCVARADSFSAGAAAGGGYEIGAAVGGAFESGTTAGEGC